MAASVSGCLGLVTRSQSEIGLALRNYTSERQPLKVQLLRIDREEYDDALVLNREFEVPAPAEGDAAGVVREHELTPRRRYLVRVLPKYGRGDWDTHQFYPGESGAGPDSELIDVGIHEDETTDALYVRFD